MASTAPLLLRMVAASANISHRAGKIIRDIMSKGDLGIVSKGKNDLQTQADRSGEKCIKASLLHQFPNVNIFGEEDLDHTDIEKDWLIESMDEKVLSLVDSVPERLRDIKEEDVVVWVDPLDGTAEYTEGLLDHVTVLIGICVNGRAEAGIIYQPYYNYMAEDGTELGRVIWGIIGMGVHGYVPSFAPEGQNIITTTRSHSNRTVVDAVEACEPTEIMRAGGCGHKVLLIMEGHAHAYVFASPGCKKWDTAAPEAILHAAGGKLTDLHGNTISYGADVTRPNKAGVLAVPKAENHEWYLKRIPDHVKKDLPYKY